MTDERGALALVLHSHMPYVEGFGTWPFGEEWLFEAMASVYLPLIALCEKWADDGRADVLTLGLTPVLCDQFEAPGLGERFRSYCSDVRIRLSHEQAVEHECRGEIDLAGALRAINQDYQRALDLFESHGGALIPVIKRLQDRGVVSLWTSAATHSLMPLVATELGQRLQLDTGALSHRRRFGSWSGGFWLPECAYSPGIESPVYEAGATAFCVDQTGKGERLDALEPVITAAGAIAVPIDWPTIELVWSDGGYPAHPAYRDYHAHSMHGMRPFNNGGGAYDAERAGPVVQDHARDFVSQVISLLDHYRNQRSRPGLVTCALDTELLGHWWYEGPNWLEAVVDQAGLQGLRLTVLPDGLDDFKVQERALQSGSWGKDKDFSTWDCPETAEFIWAARKSELELNGALTALFGTSSIQTESCDRSRVEAALHASRELLALQSSDWCFMESRKLAADYPQKRVQHHRNEFKRAVSRICTGEAKDGRQIDPCLRSLAPDIAKNSLFSPSTATLEA